LQFGGKGRDFGLNHVIRDEIEPVEPEGGETVEHFPLAWNGVGKDAIEGRDSIGGNEQEMFAKVKDFADFAAAEFFDAGKIACQKIHDGWEAKLESSESRGSRGAG